VPITRRALTLALLGAGLIVLATGAVAWMFYARAFQPYRGYQGAEQFVDIPTGTSTPAMGALLVEAGVVRDAQTFRLAVRMGAAGRTLKAGEYRFDRPMTAVEVVDKIARGDVVLRSITFPEGLTIAEMATLYEDEGFGRAAAFVEAAKNTDLVESIDPEARDLEGYLYPDTYRLPRRATAAELTRAMVRSFEQAFGPELRKQAGELGLSVREAVTLASLVEKETAVPQERFLTSAVYHNRLRIGMGLQCDPTVIYALRRAGKYDGNLTRADLQFDSPYNTYRYAGLPPGPIANPGRPALEAAVRPASVDYLYFVSRNDGSHAFSRTLEEHNRNVREFQVEYFREKRRQKQRQ
jgi:UPF0755 protein